MAAQQTRPQPVLATVAALAGVSTPTVSKVIHGHPDVAARTRTRVQAALDQLGYQSPMQRRANLRTPGQVEVLVEAVNSDYVMEVLTGILDYGNETNTEIVLSRISAEQLATRDYRSWAQQMAAAGRAGLLLITSQVTQDLLDAFSSNNLPIVVIDPWNPPPSGFVTVGATNWAGGKAATEHLLELGHERIAFIGGEEAAECAVARRHGYIAALAAAGLEPEQQYVVTGGFEREFGEAAAQKLLRLALPPTAIFACSDAVALGVLDAARQFELRVPEDLSVVGFDGTALTEQTMPRLTSVAQPLREIGRVAMRSVLALSRKEELDSHNVELATRLVVKDSTAPPRK